LLGLGPGRFEGLAHLGGHRGGDGVDLPVEDVGRGAHPLRPLPERRPPVAAEGLGRPGELGVDLLGGERVERLDRLAGGRVHGGDRHWLPPRWVRAWVVPTGLYTPTASDRPSPNRRSVLSAWRGRARDG